VPEEFLDVVNENNLVIGREERKVVHQTGAWHRGVHIFLFTPESKLLVQQRSLQRQESPGRLDCSVSEHLRAGESFIDGAKRGLREELGIEGIPLKPIIRFQMNYGQGDNMISALYEGTITGEKLTIDNNEVAQILYYSLPQLEDLIIKGDNSCSRWFRQLLLWYQGKPSEISLLH
jgi:isopentenyl-diphosphate delta-isomerase